MSLTDTKVSQMMWATKWTPSNKTARVGGAEPRYLLMLGQADEVVITVIPIRIISPSYNDVVHLTDLLSKVLHLDPLESQQMALHLVDPPVSQDGEPIADNFGQRSQITGGSSTADGSRGTTEGWTVGVRRGEVQACRWSVDNCLFPKTTWMKERVGEETEAAEASNREEDLEELAELDEKVIQGLDVWQCLLSLL